VGARECITFFVAVYRSGCVSTSLRCLIDGQYCLSLGGKKRELQSNKERITKKKLPVSSKLPLFLLQTELRRKSNEELCLSEWQRLLLVSNLTGVLFSQPTGGLFNNAVLSAGSITVQYFIFLIWD